MKVSYLVKQAWLTLTMRSSAGYWDRRYRLGLTSGSGSEGQLARYKAEVLNGFVEDRGIQRVVEFGCGDGQQLALANYPHYMGLDVSPQAIELCRKRFDGDPTRTFLHYDPDHSVNLGGFLKADLTLSLDVVYHLVEDRVYKAHLRDLFGVSSHHVVVYASNREAGGTLRHVRHRRFVEDVAQQFPEFRLVEHLPNPLSGKSFAEFHFFERTSR